jgi:ferric-dicitrate binding protein FerR (iron transport regulator)
VEKHLNLIARRLAGEITDSERQELQDWLDESTENELLFQRLEAAWRAANYRPVVKGHERVFRNISAQLRLDDVHARADGKRRSLHIRWYSAAAIFIAFICVAGLWWYGQPSGKPADEAIAQNQVIVSSNPRGQKSTVVLPDGTMVRLNSESYIEYPEEFGNQREVRLVGEAFFNVVHDSAHPFIVHSGDVSVRVLGTSFNVQAFPYEESMSVAVVTGRVVVEQETAQFSRKQGVLLPKEMLRIDHKTGTFEKKTYDPDEMVAWKDGILAFKKASFNEIADRLERWYGVKFVIKRKKPITDGFTGHYRNPSLKIVLEGMSFSSEFKFNIEGDTVLIY